MDEKTRGKNRWFIQQNPHLVIELTEIAEANRWHLAMTTHAL